ncbi:polysaccharide biosynthesis protein [Anoxybacter fermentans]|uniref:Polysaccharide biosynthesis protein n=2 Tax=Anoxybacter fermentans TaxID=1323375 RepID=A0A3S9T334_9FIRM|nr:polysaccharide biosynthesis protein [Anoxybacter fermentans]
MVGNEKVNFLKGAAILSAAGIFSRFLGLIYRIVVTRLIGAEGVGLYQMAYPIYSILLVVSVSGIPVALAKLISERMALGQKREALRTFRVALGLSFIFGSLLSILLFIGARPLVTFIDLDPRSYYSIIAIAPAILIVSVMAAYRGFFQGLQNMVPTAVSQVLEQIVRMMTMIGLVYFLLPYGIELSAAGAAFAAVTGAIAGLLILLVIYFRYVKSAGLEFEQGEKDGEKLARVVKQISNYAIPISLGALVLPLMNLVDLVFVPHRLQVIGFTVEEATFQYGGLTLALTLVHFPGIITTSLRTSLVPSISSAFTLNDIDTIKRQATRALRFAVLIGLPSSAGLYILAEPLCWLIFDEPFAAVPLHFVAWGVFFIALQQISAGILQGVGKVKVPARNLLIGAGVNAVINYTLTGIPQFGIRGAALGTVMGFATAAFLNLISLRRTVKFCFQLKDMLLKPIFAAGVMAGTVFFSNYGLYYFLQIFLSREVSKTIATIVSVGIGVVIFLITLLITGGLREQDLRALPGFKRLISPLQRLKLLRS